MRYNAVDRNYYDAIKINFIIKGRGENIPDIRVHGNDLEKALKALKRQLQRDGLFKEIKDRSFYAKPSDKEKRKQREAMRKRMKALKFKRPVTSKRSQAS